MNIILFITIILIASILQTSSGFGFSILATPFLLLLFEPKEAIQINLILSLMISLVLFAKIKKDVDVAMVKRFIIGSTAGLLLGIYIFLLLDVGTLKLTVSIIILALTTLLIFHFRIRQSKKWDVFAGTISGTLTTSIGMPGPPLLLYFSGTATDKRKLRGTTLAFYLYIYLVSLIIQIIFVGTTKTVWISSGLALPLVFVGLIAGQYLFTWMSQQFFRYFTYGLLIFTGVYLLLNR